MLLSQIYEGPERRRKGTYAAVLFDHRTVESLLELQEKLEIPNPLGEEKFHTTLLYSRRHLPNYEALGEIEPVATSDDVVYELEIWPSGSGEKNVLVLKYECAWLSDRHSKLMAEHGATWDFPNYIPHITLSYDVGEWTPTEYAVSFGTQKPIVIVEEYQEDLDLEWDPNEE